MINIGIPTGKLFMHVKSKIPYRTGHLSVQNIISAWWITAWSKEFRKKSKFPGQQGIQEAPHRAREKSVIQKEKRPFCLTGVLEITKTVEMSDLGWRLQRECATAHV